MEVVLPIYDNPVVEAIFGAMLWFTIPMIFSLVYAFSRPERVRRIKVAVWGTLISVLVSVPFINPQEAVILRANQVSSSAYSLEL